MHGRCPLKQIAKSLIARDVATATDVIRDVMATAAEPAVTLTVPLGVEIGTGKSWGAAH